MEELREDEIRTNGNLRIDKVLSTQPELGPSVPDGGYGWVILFVSLFFQLTIPSIKLAYGIIIVYSSLETTDHTNISLWDNYMIITPFLFIIFSTIMDPLGRKIIAYSKWPRLVAFAGTCLVCAGILFFWLAITSSSKYSSTACYILSGTLSGCGGALAILQCEILISQYFRLKLFSVGIVLQMAMYTGYILTPLYLGKFIAENGIAHVVFVYDLFMLTGLAICMLFKKPLYLKKKTVYNVVTRVQLSDDEEDIFEKYATELKTARHAETSIDSLPSTSGSNSVEVEIHRNWEQFSDDEEDNFKSFKDELQQDLGGPELNMPKELFTDLPINNNNTYSFDNSDVVTGNEDANIFMPIDPGHGESYGFLKEGSFYKSVVLQITIKYSLFIFFTLYPSCLYFHLKIHIEEVSTVIAYTIVFCCGILLTINICLKTNVRNRAIFIVIFSWIGTIGFYMVSDLHSEFGKVVGGAFSLISITSLQYISGPLLAPSYKTKSNRMFLFLDLFSVLSFGLLLVTNITYNNCFRLMGLLQFANGSIWFCNFVYKKILNIA